MRALFVLCCHCIADVPSALPNSHWQCQWSWFKLVSEALAYSSGLAVTTSDTTNSCNGAATGCPVVYCVSLQNANYSRFITCYICFAGSLQAEHQTYSLSAV